VKNPSASFRHLFCSRFHIAISSHFSSSLGCSSELGRCRRSPSAAQTSLCEAGNDGSCRRQCILFAGDQSWQDECNWHIVKPGSEKSHRYFM
jgi:hypothetical protein